MLKNKTNFAYKSFIKNIKLQSCQLLQHNFNLVSFEYKKVQICVLMAKWKHNVIEQNIVALKTMSLNSPVVS